LPHVAEIVAAPGRVCSKETVGRAHEKRGTTTARDAAQNPTSKQWQRKSPPFRPAREGYRAGEERCASAIPQVREIGARFAHLFEVLAPTPRWAKLKKSEK
jgi:hypothetical protein